MLSSHSSVSTQAAINPQTAIATITTHVLLWHSKVVEYPDANFVELVMLRFPFLLVRNIFALVIFLLMLPIYLLGQALRPRAHWVHLELQPRYPIAGPMGIARWFNDEQTFTDLRRDIQRLAKDPRVKGVFLSWDLGLHHGPAGLGDLRDIFQVLKDNGKEIIVHTEQLTTLDYPFANIANRIMLTPAGRLFTFAPHIEMLFLGTLLERLGIHPQFIHIGAFKTASHRFLHHSAPIAQRLMMTELLEHAATTLRHNLPNRDVDALFKDAPMDARLAAHHGLIDAEVFREDVVRYLNSDDHIHTPESLPEKKTKTTPIIPFPVWKESLLTSPWKPIFPRRNHIAVLDLSGMIISPGMPASGPVISPQDVLPILENLVMDRRVQGLILHINSPGGSALASEIIWRAIQQARREMPVVALCSDVAASGGYYLACAADAIICRPESIVGSIGVITGKFTVGDAAEKLGVGIQPLGEPSFMSMVDPLEGRLLENLIEDTRSFYRRFLDRVGAARKIPRHRLHRYARGRVYGGQAALERGLVDSVGGFEAAVEKVHELLQLTPDRTQLRPIAYQHQSIKDIAKDALMQSTSLASIKAIETLSHETQIIQMFQKEGCLALSLVQTSNTR